MKRSRILIGATSFVLAIAGFATAKAMTRQVQFYIQTSVGSSVCVVTNTQPPCAGNQRACTELSSGRQYFSSVTNPALPNLTCKTGVLKN